MDLKAMYKTHVENVERKTKANHEQMLERNRARNSNLMTAVVSVAAIVGIGSLFRN